MEQRDNSSPNFCRAGCGFYAAQAFDGLCSKCYKDLKIDQNDSPVTAVQSPTASPPSSRASMVAAAACVEDVDAVTVALSKTSLAEMSMNASNNNSPSPDKVKDTDSGRPSPRSPCSLSGSGVPTPEASLLNTGSPTVATATATVTSPKANAEAQEETQEGTSASTQDAEGASDGDKGKKPKKNRCQECRKKVGLTGFTCHCGKMFCSLHRYSDTHDCTFDFKEKGQEEIRKNNPVVKGEKIQKI